LWRAVQKHPGQHQAEKWTQQSLPRLGHVFESCDLWVPGSLSRHFLETVWSMRPLSGTTLSLAVAKSWYLVVGYQTRREWLRGFFLEHNLGRANSEMEGHSGPSLVY